MVTQVKDTYTRAEFEAVCVTNQQLRGTLQVATAHMIRMAEDTEDYLDRAEPNVPPVIRKAQDMKHYAKLARQKWFGDPA